MAKDIISKVMIDEIVNIKDLLARKQIYELGWL